MTRKNPLRRNYMEPIWMKFRMEIHYTLYLYIDYKFLYRKISRSVFVKNQNSRGKIPSGTRQLSTKLIS